MNLFRMSNNFCVLAEHYMEVNCEKYYISFIEVNRYNCGRQVVLILYAKLSHHDMNTLMYFGMYSFKYNGHNKAANLHGATTKFSLDAN